MPVVLDACALIACLRGEDGSDVVEALLEKEPERCFAHAVNLCEVFYDFLKVGGEGAATAAVDDLLSQGVVLRDDLDLEFWKQVGRFKASHRISLADAFALTLAHLTNSDLITSDRHEFETVARTVNVPIRFIR